MNWPSIVASATKAAGGANAKANEGKLTRPNQNRMTVMQAAPMYGM